MSLIIGGAISAILGLFGLIFWWSDFIVLAKGSLPLLMLFGGIIALYVGYDDIQEKLREERQRQNEQIERAREEIEMVKAQAEQYREELDRIREQTLRKES
jgi:ABC-type multidrug transport system fused ATPase/permease subunit